MMPSEEEILAIEAELEKDLEQLNEDYIRGSSPSNSSRILRVAMKSKNLYN